MLNRTNIMRNAWTNYRRDRNSRLPFSRKVFARCLANAWAGAKARAAYEVEKAGAEPIIVACLPPRFDTEMPDLGFLVTRYAMSANEAFIRAQAYA